MAVHLANSKFGKQFNMLEKQMDNFDIPAASDTLKAIAKELKLYLGEDGWIFDISGLIETYIVN